MTDSTDSKDRREPLKPAPDHAQLAPTDLRGAPLLSPAELENAARDNTDGVMLGQNRALDAIRLAVGIDAPGYNVFVTGVRSREQRDPILRLIQERAAQLPTPGDWVFVHNFESPESPISIHLEAGQARELRDRMRDLVSFVRDQVPKAFRQEDFEQERAALKEKYNKQAQELFSKVENSARQKGFAIHAGPGGQLIFVPMIDGKPPESPEALGKYMQSLSEEERGRVLKVQSELQEELAAILIRQQEMMRELVSDIREIERKVASRLMAPAVAAIDQYFHNPAVTRYLEKVLEHMINHLDRFQETGEESRPQQPGLPIAIGRDENPPFFEYQINILVDNAGRQGAPVIDETSPTYRNLFGTIERWVDPFGRSSSNFSRIVSGSFLKADGGFLVIDLQEAIIEPGVWKTLKRSLKTGYITIETLEPFAFLVSSGLKPEPLRIHTKVVVLGSPMLYNLLYFYDEEFAELFKVKAEIRPVMDADTEGVRHYAARISALATQEHLPPFDGAALARIVEFGMRRAGDRRRLVTVMAPAEDLAREAAYFARAANAQRVGAPEVERALRERVLRLNFIEEEIRRLIANRTLIVEVDGARSGQINGLAVLDVGGYMFGKPSRVTSTVSLGQAGLINIEREARLSGSTHDKGVMILAGYLRWRFGQTHPIAMTASICFEQSYSGIDGDSASSTELYGLLSALSNLPLRQDIAVTGSVDQYGHVQAIGGVNEKIEGFYRVCKVVGLSGKQGVMIPKANVENLMLEDEVIDAVARGQFHIYPVESIDQGIEILTGVRAGSIDETGTVNNLVDQRLRQMAERIRGQGHIETRVIEAPAGSGPSPNPPGPPNPQPSRDKHRGES